MSQAVTLEASLAQCREMMRLGSKSFSAASLLFGKEERDAAFLLYGWCRFCDDQIDEASKQSDEQFLRERLGWLIHETKRVYEGVSPTHPVFVAFAHIVRRYHIPEHYPLELLEGMAMDVRRETYADIAALKLYCYRVAGVVGLMMSHVMGISDPKALSHAADLGIAMQLTNIARDVVEDAEMGRVYLPLDWLREEGLGPQDVAVLKFRPQVARVVGRMLDEAERYYRSGDAGLKYLAFRPGCAVVSARNVYSEIGREVRRRGVGAWDERVWIPSSTKAWLMTQAIGRMIRSLPSRLKSPWRRAPITAVWRFS